MTRLPAVVNTRVLDSTLTGVQRYTKELLVRLRGRVIEKSPPVPLRGVAGHAWEQGILPLHLSGRLLWSPSNTGPLVVERQVVTIHDMAAIDHPEWLNPWFARWYSYLLPRLCRRVRRVLTVSHFTKERIIAIAGIRPEQVTVVPNGVDERFRPCTSEETAKVREQLGLPSSNYFLSLGSLEPRKNLARVLRAWSIAQQKVADDVWLVVAGAPGERRVFRELHLEESPARVHFAGYVADEDLPALYSGAQLFVYLSEYEGFGLPALEAMACGAPVLTSDCTSLPGVVGDGAFLVKPTDVEAVAAAMDQLAHKNELLADLRSRALARARLFTWEEAARLTWDALQEAAQA